MEIPARNLYRLSKKQRELKKAFESAKSIEETLVAFKDLQTCFNEIDLGFACRNVGLKIHQQGKDLNQALFFGLKALRIFYSNFRSSLNNGDKLALGIIETFEFLGNVCLELKRFGDCLSYLNAADGLIKTVKPSKQSDAVLFHVMCRINRNLFRTKSAMGERAKGIVHLRKVLEITEKMNGTESEEVAKVCREIAEAYVYVPDSGEALKFCLKGLEMLRKNVGDQSVKVAECRKELAFVYYTIGEFEKALEENGLAIGILKSLGGNNSSLLLKVEIQAAKILCLLRRFEQVVEILSGALSRGELDGHDRIVVMTLLVEALAKQEKYEVVRKCAESLFGLIEKKDVTVEGSNGIYTCNIAMELKEVATMCEKMNELETALSLLKVVHLIEVECPLPPKVPFLHDVCARIGWLLVSNGKKAEAIPYLKHAVETLKQSFNPVNAEVASMYLDLYKESFTSGSYSLAINSLKKETELAEKSKDTAGIKEQLMEITSKLEQFKDTVTKLEETKRIAMKLSYDTDYPVSQSLHDLCL